MCWKQKILSWVPLRTCFGQGRLGLKEWGEVRLDCNQEQEKKKKRWSCAFISQYHQVQTAELLFHNLKKGHKRILSNWETKQNRNLFSEWSQLLVFIFWRHIKEAKEKSHVYAYLWECPKVFKFPLLRTHFSGYCSWLKVWKFCCHEFYKETKLRLPRH